MKVFFAPEMVASTSSFSPSAGKPAAVVADWRRRGLPIELCHPAPATFAELATAHASAYVRDVLSCTVPNGFGNRSPEVAASLPWTSGAMLAAARHARSRREHAAAPCSGFHHAGWDHGGGFCTFNGLMVAALVLLAEGARRVGILDCDMHYGDGTDDILERLGERARIRHFTAGATYHAPRQAAAFLAELPSVVTAMGDCEVILYQLARTRTSPIRSVGSSTAHSSPSATASCSHEHPPPSHGTSPAATSAMRRAASRRCSTSMRPRPASGRAREACSHRAARTLHPRRRRSALLGALIAFRDQLREKHRKTGEGTTDQHRTGELLRPIELLRLGVPRS